MTRLLLTLLLCLLPVQSWAAIAYVSNGSPAGSTATSYSVAQPAVVDAGNLLVLCVASKYPDDGVTHNTPSLYTAPANNAGTSSNGEAHGVGTGNTIVSVFYKVADGTEDGANVTVSMVGTPNVTYAYITRFSNATGLWDVAAANGSDDATAANWSAAMSSNPGITGGDMVFSCAGRNGNVVAASAEALAADDLVVGTTTEQADNATSFGDDIGLNSAHSAITSGTASGNATYSFTSASTSSGGTVILRMREVAASSALQPSSGYLGGIIK